MRFTWDPKKAASNLGKHGVSFEEAAEVFADPRVDTDWNRTAPNFEALGMSRTRVLYVVFVEFLGEEIRIISARKATKREKRKYFDG